VINAYNALLNGKEGETEDSSQVRKRERELAKTSHVSELEGTIGSDMDQMHKKIAKSDKKRKPHILWDYL
jgi:hypothetical protein